MKRILAALLILAGMVVTGCEEEHERHYGYREREYREYRDGRPHEDYDRYDDRGYRFVNETTRNGETLRVETTVRP